MCTSLLSIFKLGGSGQIHIHVSARLEVVASIGSVLYDYASSQEFVYAGTRTLQDDLTCTARRLRVHLITGIPSAKRALIV